MMYNIIMTVKCRITMFWSTTDGTYDGSPKIIMELKHSYVLVRSQHHNVMAQRVTHVFVAMLS